MFTHHVNLLHTTYRYDPVHEDIVTHIRHRLLLCQHVGDVAKDDEKNREDCSSDNCKHLVDVNFTKSYHLYTRHQKHQKLSSQQDIFVELTYLRGNQADLITCSPMHTSYWRKNWPKTVYVEKNDKYEVCAHHAEKEEKRVSFVTKLVQLGHPNLSITLSSKRQKELAQPNLITSISTTPSSKRQSPTDNIILIVVAIFYIWYRRWRR